MSSIRHLFDALVSRDARGFAAFRPLDGLGGDVKFAVRRLLATPQFFAFAVLSIAIGIAVTTSAYSVLSSLSRPIHAAEPDRTLFLTSGGTSRRALISQPDFEDLQRDLRSFRYVAASTSFHQTLTAPSRAELIFGEAVSGDYFATLGLGLEVGRGIQPADDAQAFAVVVLGHQLWRKRFGSDPSVVGTMVRIGGHSFEVIGVAAPEVQGLNQMMLGSSVWIPLSAVTRFDRSRATAPVPVFSPRSRDDPRQRSALTMSAGCGLP